MRGETAPQAIGVDGEQGCAFVGGARSMIDPFDAAGPIPVLTWAAGAMFLSWHCLVPTAGRRRIWRRRTGRALGGKHVIVFVPAQFNQRLHPDAVIGHAFGEDVDQVLGKITAGWWKTWVPKDQLEMTDKLHR